MFNNTVDFKSDSALSFSFSHEFPSINPDKTYGFRLYVTDNDPVSVAGVYKRMIQEQGGLTTLMQKAKSCKS